MDWEIKDHLSTAITGLHLPRFHEIPNVGLYLEQTVKYINECLSPLCDEALTSSMVSNYVKRDLVDNPHKKQYSREQISYLIFIAVVKNVLSMDDIRLILTIQKESYSAERAYNYFCSELENVLAYIFGQKLELDSVGGEETNEKVMLRNIIITAALKIYLSKLFSGLQSNR